MESKRREFLKKTVVASAMTAVVPAALSAMEPKRNIKNSSGKKPEKLYEKTAHWDVYYKNAE